MSYSSACARPYLHVAILLFCCEPNQSVAPNLLGTFRLEAALKTVDATQAKLALSEKRAAEQQASAAAATEELVSLRAYKDAMDARPASTSNISLQVHVG